MLLLGEGGVHSNTDHLEGCAELFNQQPFIGALYSVCRRFFVPQIPTARSRSIFLCSLAEWHRMDLIPASPTRFSISEEPGVSEPHHCS